MEHQIIDRGLSRPVIAVTGEGSQFTIDLVWTFGPPPPPEQNGGHHNILVSEAYQGQIDQACVNHYFWADSIGCWMTLDGGRPPIALTANTNNYALAWAPYPLAVVKTDA